MDLNQQHKPRKRPRRNNDVRSLSSKRTEEDFYKLPDIEKNQGTNSKKLPESFGNRLQIVELADQSNAGRNNQTPSTKVPNTHDKMLMPVKSVKNDKYKMKIDQLLKDVRTVVREPRVTRSGEGQRTDARKQRKTLSDRDLAMDDGNDTPVNDLLVSSDALYIPDVPFGDLAFERYSWTHAAVMDLRLWNDMVTDESLITLARGNPGCIELDLRGCTLLTDDGLGVLATICTGLQVVRLAGCASITDRGINQLAKHCNESLMEIDLSSSYDLVSENNESEPRCTCRSCWSSILTSPYAMLQPTVVQSRMSLTSACLRSVSKYCPNLRTLRMKNQADVDSATVELLCKRCPELAVMDWEGCKSLNDSCVKYIGQRLSKSLTELELRGCSQVSDLGLTATLGKAHYLKLLNLSDGPKISDEGIRGLLEIEVVWGHRPNATGGFTRLRSLFLRNCHSLTSDAACYIGAGCPNLESLVLTGCRELRNASLGPIGALSKLQVLDISHCDRITDEGLRLLMATDEENDVKDSKHRLRALTHINLSYTRCTDLGLIPLVTALGLQSEENGYRGGSLAELDLLGMPDLTNGFIRHLAAQLRRQLRALRLSNNQQISAAGLGALSKCPKLENLALESCPRVQMDALETIQNLQYLRIFNISKSSHLQSLILPAWRLRTLGLRDHTRLMDDTLIDALRPCTELRVLDVAGCSKLTNNLVEDLREQHADSLRVLNACDTSIDKEALESFSAMTRYVHDATNRFRGFIPALNLQHQEAHADTRKRVAHAVLVLQCLLRRYFATKVLRQLQRAHAKRLYLAATCMQRLVRGHLGRRRARMTVLSRSFATRRIQILWWVYRDRRQTSKAVKFWTSKMSQRWFGEWKANVQQVTSARWQRATDWDTRKTLQKQLKAWRTRSLELKETRIRKEYALSHVHIKRQLKVWRIWVANVQERRTLRVRVVRVFSACVPLSHWNSTEEQAMVQKAEAWLRSHSLVDFYDYWCEYIMHMRSQWQTAIKHHATHTLHAHLNGWKEFKNVTQYLRDKEKSVTSMSVIQQRRLAISMLKRHAQGKTHRRNAAVAALRHCVASTNRQFFAAWIEARDYQKYQRALNVRAVQARKVNLLRNTLLVWHDQAMLQREQRQMVTKYMRTNGQKNLETIFVRWRDDSRAVAAFRRGVAESRNQTRLAIAWQNWTGEIVVQRNRRETQAAMWKSKYVKAATNVQAIWRNVRLRESEEEARLVAQFMALRIQQWVRRLLAQLLRYRLRRKAAIRAFDKMEAERAQMIEEDGYGVLMVREYRAACALQCAYRVRRAKGISLRNRRARAVQNELQRQAQVSVQLELQVQRQAQRAEEFAALNASALHIQRLVRGARGRRYFTILWVQRFHDEQATRIQSAYRGYLGRRLAAAERRHAQIVRSTRKRQQSNARALRMMGLRNRRQQEMALSILDATGLHPDTFNLNVISLHRELMGDFKTLVKDMAGKVGFVRNVFRLRRRQREKQEKIRKDEKQDIQKGDAVMIVAPQNPHRGKTGFVLDVVKAQNVPGRKQAIVKLDLSDEVVFVALQVSLDTETVPKHGPGRSYINETEIHTMKRIDACDRKWKHMSPAQVEENRRAIEAYARELHDEMKTTRAVLLIQRTFRGRRMRAKFKAAYQIQSAKDTAKKAKLLKWLRRFGLDNARVGRLLVATGLVWPRYIPDMPERSLSIETWMHNRKVRKEYATYQKWRVGRIEADRLDVWKENQQQKAGRAEATANIDCVSALENPNERHHKMSEEIEMQLTDQEIIEGVFHGELRWRTRKPMKVFMYRLLYRVTDAVLAPFAEILQTQADNTDTETAMYGVWKRMAKFFGGPVWRSNQIENKIWVGAFIFPGLKRSKHVNLDGVAFFHGTWDRKGLPHGFGIMQFPDGGLSKQEILGKLWSVTSEVAILEDAAVAPNETENEMIEHYSSVADSTSIVVETVLDSHKEIEEAKSEESKPLKKERVKHHGYFTKLGFSESREIRTGFVRKDQVATRLEDFLYDTIIGNVDNGELTGLVRISYGCGDIYLGQYQLEDAPVPSTDVPLLVDHVGSLQEDNVPPSQDMVPHPDVEEFDLHVDSYGQWECPDGTIFQGATVSNHFIPVHATGVMKVSFPNNDCYLGNMRNGKRNGIGRMDFENGDSYFGMWVNDVPHGLGCYEWESGVMYVGYIRKGRMHGLGTHTLRNGASYSGSYKNHRFEGQGTLKLPNGGRYDGTFHKGVCNGMGKMVYADGSVYVGRWKLDARWTHELEFGEFTDANGNEYKVPYVNDGKEGRGTFIEAASHKPRDDGEDEEDPRVVREGFWSNDELETWLHIGVNRTITNTFCSRFKVYGDYRSVFALQVAQMLPELPPGVDPGDRRVEQHVNGIVRRSGKLIGKRLSKQNQEMEAECKEKLEILRAQFEDVQKRVSECTASLEANASERAEQEKVVLEEQQALDALNKEVHDFWSEPRAASAKRAFTNAVQALRPVSLEEWIELRRKGRVPLIWHTLWNGLCNLFYDCARTSFQDQFDKRKADELCGPSPFVIERKHSDASMREYQVMLLYKIDSQFNVYKRCKAESMLHGVSEYMLDKGVDPGNTELIRVSESLAPPLVTLFRSAYTYIKLARDIVSKVTARDEANASCTYARHTMDQLLAEHAEASNRMAALSKEEALISSQLQRQETLWSSVLLTQSQISQMLIESLSSSGELRHKFTHKIEHDEDLIDPWITRKDEHILNTCQKFLDDIIGLIADVEPEVWACVITMRELTIEDSRYEKRHQASKKDENYIDPEVRNIVHELVNRTAYDSPVELQVSDLMEDLLMQVCGPEPEVHDVLEDILTQTVNAVEKEKRANLRNSRFKGKRVSVKCTKREANSKKETEVTKFGTCLKTYDYDQPVYDPPRPGTGVIYYDGDTNIYACENECSFLTEIAVGDLIMLPGLTIDTHESRTVMEVVDDTQIIVHAPFSENVASGEWTKQWGIQKPNLVVNYVPYEMVDVKYDNGQEECLIELSRVSLVQDDASKAKAPAKPKAPPIVWEEYFDDGVKAPYWFHRDSGKTTWQRPDTKENVWIRYKDETSGLPYWHNQKLNITSWESPN